VNALDFQSIENLMELHQITDVYLMAALLSATAEKTRFCLGLEYEFTCSTFLIWRKPENKKIFWPSSIAAFGPTQKRKTATRYTPLWNLQRFTESVNKLEKDGGVLP
jgi:hypothetical protein